MNPLGGGCHRASLFNAMAEKCGAKLVKNIVKTNKSGFKFCRKSFFFFAHSEIILNFAALFEKGGRRAGRA